MKRKKLLSSLQYTDEKYLKEADPASPHRLNYRILSAVIAASLCLVTVLNLWLFLPYSSKAPNVSKYSDSEYYGIIKKVSTYQHNRKKSSYKNNFDKLFTRFEDGLNSMLGAMDGSDKGDASGGAMGDRYEEVTDNQTSGVIEGDRIKRSDSHIYYLVGSTLSVYSIEKEESKKVGSFDLSGVPLLSAASAYHDEWEFFLSSDCRTVTVLAPCYHYETKDATVAVLSLDVRSPEDITLKDSFTVSGAYLSSRKTENGFLLFTRFSMKNTVDFDDKSTFLPQIDRGNGAEFLPAEDIFSPEELSSLSYTVVLQIKEDGLTLDGVSAFLSYSDEVYVSAENIFAVRGFTLTEVNGGKRITKSATEIACLGYGEGGLSHKGSFTVDGTVKDRYSLDEHEGILRVVTTVRERVEDASPADKDGSTQSPDLVPFGTTVNASLFCIRLSDFSCIAKVERFAPNGEIVQSARFDGVNAYVCTSIEKTDPVFYFDLSDLSAITVKDTGTIDGFSTSLIQLGDGYLLGIGEGVWGEVKLEVYKETANGVISVSEYGIKDASYSTEYKSYYIDRENRIVGLGILEYTGESYYLAVLFDGYDLHKILKAPIDGDNDYKRAVYIDGCFYVFGENGFYTKNIVS